MNDVNGLADIILGKQRHGPTGTVKVEFEGIYTKFKDLSKKLDINLYFSYKLIKIYLNYPMMVIVFIKIVIDFPK